MSIFTPASLKVLLWILEGHPTQESDTSLCVQCAHTHTYCTFLKFLKILAPIELHI